MKYLDLPILRATKNKDGVYRYCYKHGFCWAPDYGIKVIADGKVVYQRILYKGYNPEKIKMIDLRPVIREKIRLLTEAITLLDQ